VQKDSEGRGTYRTADGKTVATLRGNVVTEIRSPDTVVRRPVAGTRTVIVQRPGNRTIVVQGAARGYVQRPVTVEGHIYVKRTYYVNQVGFVRVYRPFVYRGVTLYLYTPVLYYPAPFYIWAMGPWAAPAAYPWGWFDDPWYVYYGPYFRPYPAYARASFWLTDFLIATTLEAAYLRDREERGAGVVAATEAPNPEPVEPAAPMSEEVKDMVEAEVRRQLAQAQTETEPAVSKAEPRIELPQALSNGPHTFVAPDFIEVDDSAGGKCVIGQGDVVGVGAMPRNGTSAQLQILAGKVSDCPVGSKVTVPFADVIEMNNHMRATIDEGLKNLRGSQGKGAIPELPALAAAAPTRAQFARNLTTADPDVGQILRIESQRAEELEQSVRADTEGAAQPLSALRSEPLSPEAALGTSRVSEVKIGQSETEVTAILGEPQSTSFLGGLHKVLQYPGGKITFADGLVSVVELPAAVGQTPVPAPSVASTTQVLTQPPGARRGAVQVGQTEDEVTAILGQPLQVSFLGGVRKMYEYRDQKVIFVDGQVAEIRR
jgi:hypothetical protein